MRSEPATLALHTKSFSVSDSADIQGDVDIRRAALVLGHGQFYLNAVDTVDTVNEENKDEDEGNLCTYQPHIRLFCMGGTDLHPIL